MDLNKIYLKTKNNNFLVQDGEKFAYFNDKRDFVREATKEEFDWLFSIITKGNPEFIVELEKAVEEKMLFQWSEEFDFSKLPERWEVEEIENQRVSEDFSNYDENLCNNGGCYGFWEILHKVKLTNSKNSYYAWYITKHCTCDFDYCPSCGGQCQGYQEMDVEINGKIIGFTKETYNGCRNTIHIY